MKNSELYRKQFNKIIKVLPEFENYTVTLSLEDNVYHCTELVNAHNCTKMNSNEAVLVKNVKLKDSFDSICANCLRSIRLTADLTSPLKIVFDKLTNLVTFEEKINALQITDKNYVEEIKNVEAFKIYNIDNILDFTYSKKTTFFMLDFVQAHVLKLQKKFEALSEKRAAYVQTETYREELFEELAQELLPISKAISRNSILKKTLEPVIFQERKKLIQSSGWCLVKVSGYSVVTTNHSSNTFVLLQEILDTYKILISPRSYFAVYHMPQILLDYLELKGFVSTETPLRFMNPLNKEIVENLQGLITDQGPNSDLKHVLRVAKTV